MNEPQERQSQVTMIASLAFKSGGTCSRKKRTVIVNETTKYSFFVYLFDFPTKRVELRDKKLHENLVYNESTMHVSIGDSMLLVTVNGIGGSKKAFCQLHHSVLSIVDGELYLVSPELSLEVIA